MIPPYDDWPEWVQPQVPHLFGRTFQVVIPDTRAVSPHGLQAWKEAIQEGRPHITYNDVVGPTPQAQGLITIIGYEGHPESVDDLGAALRDTTNKYLVAPPRIEQQLHYDGRPHNKACVMVRYKCDWGSAPIENLGRTLQLATRGLQALLLQKMQDNQVVGSLSVATAQNGQVVEFLIEVGDYTWTHGRQAAESFFNHLVRNGALGRFMAETHHRHYQP